jgi:hypothetical protein
MWTVPKLAQQKQDLYRFKALIAKMDVASLPNIEAIAANLQNWCVYSIPPS